MSENQEKSLKKLIDLGSNIAGSVTGATLGFLLAGPAGGFAGAVAGPTVGNVIKQIGTEIANRILGPREQERIGAAIRFTANKIDENLAQGLEIRQDDFFIDKINERSTATEIVEGILLTTQKEYQEKKIKFQSNLLANLAFHSDVDRDQANLLIKFADLLSYRQLCLISIIVNKNKFQIPEQRIIKKGTIKPIVSSLMQELYDTYLKGLTGPVNEGYWLKFTDMVPGQTKVHGMGGQLYKLMELGNIDRKDLEQVAELLRKI